MVKKVNIYYVKIKNKIIRVSCIIFVQMNVI